MRGVFRKVSNPSVLQRFTELDKANAHAFETELAGWAQMVQRGCQSE